MMRTSCFSMRWRWWWSLCARPTRWLGF